MHADHDCRGEMHRVYPHIVLVKDPTMNAFTEDKLKVFNPNTSLLISYFALS